MSEAVSMLFKPSAFPMRVVVTWVADGTNMAMDQIFGTAMHIGYPRKLTKWRNVIAKWR